MSNYPKIEEIILRLNSDELLKEKIYIVGGTVPYLVTKTISNREHSDIDIIVEEKNMDIVREYLKRNKLYEEKYDSKDNYSFDLVKDILSGKYGFMCQYDRKTDADTVWSVIYDIGNNVIYRVEGNPKRKEFKRDMRFKFKN